MSTPAPSTDAAFAQLYRTNVDRVMAYCLRQVAPSDAEDVVSEAFLIAWRRRQVLPEPPLPWLLVTARNLIADSRRRHVRAPTARLGGAAIQAGQRVQPDPAQTISASPLDPNQPVHPAGPGQYFLRRSTTTAGLGHGVESVQRAVWFDDQGTMWSFTTDAGGAESRQGPGPATDPDNPLSFMATLPQDPALARQQLANRPGGLSDSVQRAAQANLTPNQYRTLRAVLLREKGAKEHGDATDSLSRPASVVETPGVMGTVLCVYFAKQTAETTEVRTMVRSANGDQAEIGRWMMVAEVRPSAPTPPFEPVVPSYTVPVTQTMNRDVAPGQYLRRSVRVTTADGSIIDGSQWVDAQQRRWLATTTAGLNGPDEVQAPAGTTPQEYLAAMPDQVSAVDRWFVQGFAPDCGACVLRRADALMLSNLDAARRSLVIAAIARQEGATDTLIPDSLGRAARELRLEVIVDGQDVEHVYRYDPITKELLEWVGSDSGGASATGVTGSPSWARR